MHAMRTALSFPYCLMLEIRGTFRIQANSIFKALSAKSDQNVCFLSYTVGRGQDQQYQTSMVIFRPNFRLIMPSLPSASPLKVFRDTSFLWLSLWILMSSSGLPATTSLAASHQMTLLSTCGHCWMCVQFLERQNSEKPSKLRLMADIVVEVGLSIALEEFQLIISKLGIEVIQQLIIYFNHPNPSMHLLCPTRNSMSKDRVRDISSKSNHFYCYPFAYFCWQTCWQISKPSFSTNCLFYELAMFFSQTSSKPQRAPYHAATIVPVESLSPPCSMPLRHTYSHLFTSPSFCLRLWRSSMLRRASQAMMTLSTPSAPGQPLIAKQWQSSSRSSTPNFSGKNGSLGASTSILLLSAYFSQHYQNLSQSFPKFSSASRPPFTYYLALGRYTCSSMLSHQLGGLSCMAKDVKRADTKEPRYPRGL